MDKNKKYYIQDLHSVNGDFCMFWKPHGYGKTAILSEAGLFSLKYIQDLQDNPSNKHLVFTSEEYVNKVKKSVVLLENLRK